MSMMRIAGIDDFHDGLADADGVVFDVEVGHEADDVLGVLDVLRGCAAAWSAVVKRQASFMR